MRVAARVDLTGMDTSKLTLYSYDSKTNSDTQIRNPDHRIDSHGYLWFTTPYAGSIVISEGALAKK